MRDYIVANISEVPALQNGFTTQFSQPITIIRRGDMGIFSGFVGRSPQATNGQIIAQLSNPLLFPPRPVTIICQDSNNTFAGRIDISSSGAISYVLGVSTSYIGNGNFPFCYF